MRNYVEVRTMGDGRQAIVEISTGEPVQYVTRKPYFASAVRKAGR